MNTEECMNTAVRNTEVTKQSATPMYLTQCLIELLESVFYKGWFLGLLENRNLASSVIRDLFYSANDYKQGVERPQEYLGKLRDTMELIYVINKELLPFIKEDLDVSYLKGQAARKKDDFLLRRLTADTLAYNVKHFTAVVTDLMESLEESCRKNTVSLT